MTAGLSSTRLDRVRAVASAHVERGVSPGLVTVINRHGQTHVEAIGAMAVGGSQPMQRDTLFRISSMTKPVTAAAALILVEECVLRLDDPVDNFLPELAGMAVLRTPQSPIDDTVPARRPISLRDLLTFRLGTGDLMEPPGTMPLEAGVGQHWAGCGPTSAGAATRTRRVDAPDR